MLKRNVKNKKNKQIMTNSRFNQFIKVYRKKINTMITAA